MSEALKHRPDEKQQKKEKKKEERIEKELDEGLKESFPTSDPLAIVQPGGPDDPGKNKQSGQN